MPVAIGAIFIIFFAIIFNQLMQRKYFTFKDLKPNLARISLTSEAIKVNRFTTLSGVPVNLSLNFVS